MPSSKGNGLNFGRVFLGVALLGAFILLLKNYQHHHHARVEKSEPVIQQLETKVADAACTLTFISVAPQTPDAKKPKLLLLHGAKFSASTWNEIGTLAKLKEWGYRAVALNLKGVNNCASSLSNEARAELIHKVVEKLGLAKVVVVSPSKSGELSIPYIMKPEYHSEIAGYVSIAPLIDHKTYAKKDFENLKQLKVLIVQGAKDGYFATDSLSYLSNIPNNQQVVIADAGHSCYIDKPDVWHDKLKEFLQSLHV